MKKALGAFAAGTILVFATRAEAGTQGRVTGKVTDSAGNPLEGVTVTITTPGIKNFKLSVQTNKSGQYGFIVNDATLRYNMKFEKEGHAPAEQTSKKFSTVEVTVVDQKLLRPSEAGPAAGAPAAPSASDLATLAFNAGVDLYNSGDKDGAEAKFKEALAKNADLPQGWQVLAKIAYEKKDWAKALEYGQKALDLDPTMTDLYGVLMDASEKSGNKKAAAEWRKKYEEANPDTPEILYNKGIDAYNQGKMKDAEASLTRAVEVKPDFAIAHFWLGMASFNLNRKAAAKEHLQKYLELDPNGKEASTAKEILPLLK